MRIRTVVIKNYKCIGPDQITIDFSENIVVLIGENNVGKSAILGALDYFFSGIKTLPPEHFYNKQNDFEHAITITITFCDLTPGDKAHQAVSPYITTQGSEKLWILRKVYYYDADGKSNCDHIAIVNGEEKRNPAGLTQNPNDLFTEEKMQKIFIEAVKDVKEVVDGGPKTPFNQIFNLILREDLEQTPQYATLLSALTAYGQLFQGATQLTKIKDLETSITQKLSRTIIATSKIKAESPKADKLLPIPKLTTNDGRIIDVDPSEQGHGLQRSIIFALLEMLAETNSPIDKDVGPNNLLLIEEPEIYMHPQMERKIADTLYEIASSGKAQVICTTHSPIFIRIADKHKAMVRLVRNDDVLKAIQRSDVFSGDDREEKRKQLRMITNFDPTVNEIFFAKRIVLVEGDTEVAVFREAAELLNYFESEVNKHKKRDTTFVNCRGKWTINLFQEVLNHFDIDYVVIHDKDGEALDEGANGKILTLLSNIEDRRRYFDDKIETVIGIRDVGSEKPIRALERINQLHDEGGLEHAFGSFIKFAYDIV